jgi:hypothetical protein
MRVRASSTEIIAGSGMAGALGESGTDTLSRNGETVTAGARATALSA